jgi:hypothetical protein
MRKLYSTEEHPKVASFCPEGPTKENAKIQMAPQVFEW